jgi:hypothetical protein
MKLHRKNKLYWVGILLLTFALVFSACGEGDYYEDDDYELESEETEYEADEAESGTDSVVSGNLAREAAHIEIINETDYELCGFLAVPEDTDEFTDDHIFSEEYLAPGESFAFYDLEVGSFYLAAFDCDDYEIVVEPVYVEYESGSLVWYVGYEVEYLEGAIPEVAVAEETNDESETSSSNTDSSSSAAVPSGESDIGFRPNTDGFRFENYGNESVSSNLTAVELQRMFGDQVCASQAGGECILTPPAKQWMQEVNEYMDGGHCEGMAVLSLLMYVDEVDPNQFGGESASQLSLSNQALQREIAYWWATQATTPATSVRIDSSPRAVVDALIETYTSYPAADESWVMGIYMPDWSGGHAITPFAVEDVGDGIYNILVYDNNWPDQIRKLLVDYEANTWSYQASTNPNEPESLYEGDQSTQSLEIIGLSKRLVQQDCDFCAGSGQGYLGKGRGLAAATQSYNQIWLNGQADLLITTTDGKRLGFDGGEFVNEIPGAESKNMKFGVDIWDINNEPVYYIPLGVEFSIKVDASRATAGITSSVAMIGPGYNLVIADLYLDPGEADVITVSPDGSKLAYSTEYNDAPDMIFGVETPAADYEFIVAALNIEAGAEFVIELDITNGLLSINTDNTTEFGSYEIVMDRIADDGESWFQNDDIYLEPGDTAYLLFEEWEGPGSSMYIDIDYGSDGEIDESLELVDEYEGG